MKIDLILLFFGLSIVNVFLQTAKTLIMIKTDNQHIIGLVQAIVYGFYTIILVYTNCDLSLLWKILICALANFIGSELSYIAINPILKKLHKDKLWKIEMAIFKENFNIVENKLKEKEIPYNYIAVGKYIMFNCYCDTQENSKAVKKLAVKVGAKFSAYESKAM